MKIKNIATASVLSIGLFMSVQGETQAQTFTDVNTNNWYYDEIEEFKDLGIISGYNDNTFKPKSNMTRAHAAKVIVEAMKTTGSYENLKKPSSNTTFKDVKKTSWAYDYINLMKANGIVSGYEDGTFKPNNKVTRIQFIKMLSEAFDIEKSNGKNPFSDIKKGSWGETYIKSAYNNGIVTTGYDKKFNPNKAATREDLVNFTSKAMEWDETKSIPIENIIFEKSNALNEAEKDSVPSHIPYKNSYKTLKEGIINADEFVYYDKNEIKSFEQFKDFFYKEFFWGSPVGNYVNAWTYYSDGKVKLTYAFERDVVRKKIQQANKKADAILKEIIKPTYNDFEKVKAVHDYIVLNTEYDYDVYTGKKTSKDAYTAYGALVNGLAVCDGYARAMVLMLDRLGIENQYIAGDITKNGSITGSHAWNLIKLDNKYYYLDATFNDPINTPKDFIRYDYFLVDEHTMNKDRVWDKNGLPRANSKKYMIR